MDISLYLAAIIQGVTEALPISSSMHLGLFGLRDTIGLELITGLAGFIYLCITGGLFSPLKAGLMIAYDFIVKVPNKTKLELGILCIIILALSVVLRVAKLTYLLAIINSIVILFAGNLNNRDNKLPSNEMLFIVSTITNLLATFPGFSRLGTVYAGLRYIGYNEYDAFKMSMIQGFFIQTAGLFFHFGLLHKTQFSIPVILPMIICGLIYYYIISFLLRLKRAQISWTVRISCIYRIIICLVLSFIMHR